MTMKTNEQTELLKPTIKQIRNIARGLRITTKPKYVFQKGRTGCGIAALAMLLDTSYDEMERRVQARFGLGVGHEHGMFEDTIYEVLDAAGGAFVGRHRAIGGVEPRLKWPPKPFAPVHLCFVRVYKNSPTSHFSVMTSNGKILDPMMQIYRLEDYFQVYGVTGIYRRNDAF